MAGPAVLQLIPSGGGWRDGGTDLDARCSGCNLDEFNLLPVRWLPSDCSSAPAAVQSTGTVLAAKLPTSATNIMLVPYYILLLPHKTTGVMTSDTQEKPVRRTARYCRSCSRGRCAGEPFLGS